MLTEQKQEFARSVEAPGRARRFVRDILSRWRLNDLSQDASVVVTELVTNAVTHAESSATVTITHLDSTVKIAVTDHSAEVPRVRRPTPADLSGRGLAMLSSLVREWGFERLDGGKSVWAVL